MNTSTVWTTRVWREHRAGNISRTERDVLLTLRTFRGAGGTMHPSHATLADRARCSSRSVIRALQQAQRLGLVSWAERRVRAGWRWLRTSNAYRLHCPETPTKPDQRPAQRRLSTDCHEDRGGESPSKKALLREMMEAASRLPDLLAARRRVIEASLTGTRFGRIVPACGQTI